MVKTITFKTMNKENILNALDDCLITDDEYKQGDVKWNEMFTDPFTEWTEMLKSHPLRQNFKERDGEWEDDDDSDCDEEVEEEDEEKNI